MKNDDALMLLALKKRPDEWITAASIITQDGWRIQDGPRFRMALKRLADSGRIRRRPIAVKIGRDTFEYMAESVTAGVL